MAKAVGTRLAAAFFLGVSFIPPWLQAIFTLPIGLSLWRSAKQKENEREKELAAINDN